MSGKRKVQPGVKAEASGDAAAQEGAALQPHAQLSVGGGAGPAEARGQEEPGSADPGSLMKMSLSLRCDTRELAGRKSALGAAVEAALQNVVTEFGCREVKVEWTRVAPSEDTKQKVRKKSNKKGEDADVAKRKTDEEGEGGEAPVAKKKARGDGPGRGNASKGSHPEGITPPKYAQIIRALREAAGEGPTVARVLSKIPDGSKFAAESRLLYALSILKNQFKCVTSAGQGDDQLWFAVDGV